MYHYAEFNAHLTHHTSLLYNSDS